MLVVLLSVLMALMVSGAWAEEAEPTVYRSGDYRYVLLEDGTAEIAGYNGEEEELTVPVEIDGYAVADIGDSAFSRCDSLTSITLPDGITAIGDDAFYKCRALTSVTLPASLTSIADTAFKSCGDITFTVPAIPTPPSGARTTTSATPTLMPSTGSTTDPPSPGAVYAPGFFCAVPANPALSACQTRRAML